MLAFTLIKLTDQMGDIQMKFDTILTPQIAQFQSKYHAQKRENGTHLRGIGLINSSLYPHVNSVLAHTALIIDKLF